jgi:hypothetical protein
MQSFKMAMFGVLVSMAVLICLGCGDDNDDANVQQLERVDDARLAAYFGIPAQEGEKNYKFADPNSKFGSTVDLVIFRGRDPTVFGDNEELISFEWRIGNTPVLNYYFEIKEGVMSLRGFLDKNLDDQYIEEEENEKIGVRVFEPPVEWFAPYADKSGNPDVAVGYYWDGEETGHNVTFQGAVEAEGVKHEIQISSQRDVTTLEETPREVENAYQFQHKYRAIGTSGAAQNQADHYTLEPDVGFVEVRVDLLGTSYSLTLSELPQ